MMGVSFNPAMSQVNFSGLTERLFKRNNVEKKRSDRAEAEAAAETAIVEAHKAILDKPFLAAYGEEGLRIVDPNFPRRYLRGPKAGQLIEPSLIYTKRDLLTVLKEKKYASHEELYDLLDPSPTNSNKSVIKSAYLELLLQELVTCYEPLSGQESDLGLTDRGKRVLES